MPRYSLILTLGSLLALTACGTPGQRAAARQQALAEEARENFEARKEEERERAEEAAEEARQRAEEVADARRRAAEDAARYRAYEVEYARQLGKKPSQLTPAERAWVREHF